MKKIALLVGARPNYMKIAPLWRLIRQKEPGISQLLIHTGQHYDKNLSDIFFQDLGMPEPDICLEVGSGSHAEQTGRVMIAIEPVLGEHSPDLLVVVGDVNSTMAGALSAVKLGIPTAHIEAGMRSFDRAMPEEINRVVTDSISDLLFTSCRDAVRNLRADGAPEEKIHFVGNIMIDSLVHVLPKTRTSTVLQSLDLERRGYVCVTLHRPSNVDDADKLSEILAALDEISGAHKVVFPIHPRTKRTIDRLAWKPAGEALVVTDPLGYIDFMCLMANSGVVITDSGGIQEETTYLGIPCLTVRENTERPITIEQGTNRLVKASHGAIAGGVREALLDCDYVPPEIELWDGNAAARIFDAVSKSF